MIQCQDSAMKYIIQTVLQGKGVVIHSCNKSRHKVIKTPTNEKWYCVFKREFYHTFSKEYPHLGEEEPMFANQEGESLNKECFNNAQRFDCNKIVFIHPDKTYWIYTNQFLNFAVNRHLIRIQDKLNEYKIEGGKKKAVQEITLSVPVGILQVM